MPDHIHLLVSGLSDSSDQWQCNRLIRQETARLIAPLKLQPQSHDHVLKKEELARDAFQAIAYYIQQNPVRKNLCATWGDYPFTGCVVPGYFALDPRDEDYWELYWRIYGKLVERDS